MRAQETGSHISGAGNHQIVDIGDGIGERQISGSFTQVDVVLGVDLHDCARLGIDGERAVERVINRSAKAIETDEIALQRAVRGMDTTAGGEDQFLSRGSLGPLEVERAAGEDLKRAGGGLAIGEVQFREVVEVQIALGLNNVERIDPRLESERTLDRRKAGVPQRWQHRGRGHARRRAV